jgi:hypothetical protein
MCKADVAPGPLKRIEGKADSAWIGDGKIYSTSFDAITLSTKIGIVLSSPRHDSVDVAILQRGRIPRIESH